MKFKSGDIVCVKEEAAAAPLWVECAKNKTPLKILSTENDTIVLHRESLKKIGTSSRRFPCKWFTISKKHMLTSLLIEVLNEV